MEWNRKFIGLFLKKIVYRRKKIRRIVSAFEALICCIPIILKGLSQMKSANMFWWFPPRKPELGELLLCMCYGIDRLLSLSEWFFQIWTPENYWWLWLPGFCLDIEHELWILQCVAGHTGNSRCILLPSWPPVTD